jgi:hypothetical protein
MELTLTHLSGSKKGAVDTFTSFPLKLGRGDDCQLRFDPDKDLKVSATHAELRRDGAGNLEIADLDSKNGVMVNGVKVVGAAPVPNHAVVELGPDGPKFKVKIDAGGSSGGFSFNRARAQQEAVPGVKHLRTTDESPAYREEDLEPTQPAVPAKSGASPVALVMAAVAALALIGAVVFFAVR